jgi:hypothetical protein
MNLRERVAELRRQLPQGAAVDDVTPRGRGDWYASLDYGTKVKQDR